MWPNPQETADLVKNALMNVGWRINIVKLT